MYYIDDNFDKANFLASRFYVIALERASIEPTDSNAREELSSG